MATSLSADPSPIHIKSTSGSFHQGDQKFGSTAGIQCMCNSLLSICWSAIKRISSWKSFDLDYVLECGDDNFKNVKIYRPLSVEELPSVVNIEQRCVAVVLGDKFTGFLGDVRYFAQHNAMNSASVGNGLIFIAGGYSVSIIWEKMSIYLFDPHSRDSHGSFSLDGSSILLKFKSLCDVQSHIKKNYRQNLADFENCPFEVQYVQINVDDEATADIKKTVDKQRASSRKQKYISKNFLRKEQNNEKRRENYAKKKMHKTISTRISNFKITIKAGPVFICIVCHRCLYKRSVVKYNAEKYDLQHPDIINEIKSCDGEYYVCLTCHKKLLKDIIPAQAVFNKLEIFDLPDNLLNINKLEKTIVARRILFKKIAIMPKGQSPKLKGAICNVPINVSDIPTTLPVGADSNGIVVVKLKRKLSWTCVF